MFSYQQKHLKKIMLNHFCFLMDASMLGVGVGFDTKGAGEIIVKGNRKIKIIKSLRYLIQEKVGLNL